MRTITPKQNNYALNLFKGMSQREAYIQAGYSSNQSVAVIDNNAYNLAKSNEIVMRLEELSQASDSSVVMDVRERKERLSELATEDITNKDLTPIRTSNIQAIVELNRMDQLTDKQPININYQAILDRAKEIEKDFIEGKYCDKTSERDIIEDEVKDV